MRYLALLGLACTSIGSPGCEQLVGIERVTLFADSGPPPVDAARPPVDAPPLDDAPPDPPPDALARAVQQLSLGGGHSCVLWSTGQISCWGTNGHGQLGRGNRFPIGDDEAIAPLPAVTLGGTALSMSSDGEFNCARLSTGAVRCWGSNVLFDCEDEPLAGQLGYSGQDCIGDDELPSSAGNVQIGGTALAVATGAYHACAQLSAGGVRCWGFAESGQLGLGDTENIGDNERPDTVGLVPVTRPEETVRTIVGGVDHTCILLESGQVRCWGSAQYGQIGSGDTENIGDDEPASPVDVDVGGVVTQIVAGAYHTCALLETGELRCWGRADEGRLGLGPVTLPNGPHVGDDEVPAAAPAVDVGGQVQSMAAGFTHTCVALVGGDVRCWGKGEHGTLGYGIMEPGGADKIVGDDETPASMPPVDIGAPVAEIAAGFAHTCALTSAGQVFCWGFNGRGQLGYGDNGDTEDVGDNEHPREVGPVPLGE
jgi:alpha-tubulin suppressor-like RCC1 family protein